MPRERRSTTESVHATAVAISGDGLLIIGPSKSGKSQLALALIAVSTRRRSISLIGDDRVLLVSTTHGIEVRGHPRIQGFIERRGLGIQACPFIDRAPARGIVDLGTATKRPPLLKNLPTLGIVHLGNIDAKRALVLDWWRDVSTTPRAKRSAAA